MIPWHLGDDLDRRSALDFVQWWLAGELEQFEHTVTVAWLNKGKPWCKAAAVAAGLDACSGRVLVVHDADVLPHHGTLSAAITAVLDGVPWAMPHGPVRRLTDEASEDVYRGRAGLSDDLQLAERAYNGVAGGGCVVLPRVVYADVPLDRRFIGWGQEDTSWAKALRTLVGEPVRFNGPLWHLWHEPQPRASRRVGSANSRALAERYRLAMRSRAAMRALVDDGKAAV